MFKTRGHFVQRKDVLFDPRCCQVTISRQSICPVLVLHEELSGEKMDHALKNIWENFVSTPFNYYLGSCRSGFNNMLPGSEKKVGCNCPFIIPVVIFGDFSSWGIIHYYKEILVQSSQFFHCWYKPETLLHSSLSVDISSLSFAFFSWCCSVSTFLLWCCCPVALYQCLNVCLFSLL